MKERDFFIRGTWSTVGSLASRTQAKENRSLKLALLFISIDCPSRCASSKVVEVSVQKAVVLIWQLESLEGIAADNCFSFAYAISWCDV